MKNILSLYNIFYFFYKTSQKNIKKLKNLLDNLCKLYIYRLLHYFFKLKNSKIARNIAIL